VLQFRADREPQRRTQRQLILYKTTKQVVAGGRRVESEDALASVVIHGETIAHTPDHFLISAQRPPVLDLRVDGMEIVDEAWIVAMGAVVIRTKIDLRRVGYFVSIPPEDVPPAHIDIQLASRPGSRADQY